MKEHMTDVVMGYIFDHPALFRRIDSIGDTEQSVHLILEMREFFCSVIPANSHDALLVLLRVMDDIFALKRAGAKVQITEDRPWIGAPTRFHLRSRALDILAIYTQPELSDFRNHFGIFGGGIDMSDYEDIWTFDLNRVFNVRDKPLTPLRPC